MRDYQNFFRTPAGTRYFSVPLGKKLQTAGKNCRTLGALILATSMLVACAGQDVERPIAQMTRAESAIQNAIQAGARKAAPSTLQTAQRHLAAAQQAVADENFFEARRLSEKAEADAQLAEATARSESTYETLAELEEGIRVLQEELDRNSSQR